MNATTHEPTAAERELDLSDPLEPEQGPDPREEQPFGQSAPDRMPEANVETMPATGSARSLAPEAETTGTQLANPTPTQMIHSAIQRGYDPETLRQLMDLHKEWEANEARKAYYDAISNFRAEAPRIEKNQLVDYPQKSGGRTKYRHATLDNVQRAVDPILARHGLNYRWDVQPQGGNVLRVWCIVSHRAGHTESTYLDGPFDQSGQKNALQAMGSTQKYLQRYTLEAMLGVSSSEPDDDGRTGGGPPVGDAPPYDDADPNVERITEEQRANIEDLLTEVAKNPEKVRKLMLTHYWVRHLSELPADKYDDCIQRLESMRQHDPDPQQ